MTYRQRFSSRESCLEATKVVIRLKNRFSMSELSYLADKDRFVKRCLTREFGDLWIPTLSSLKEIFGSHKTVFISSAAEFLAGRLDLVRCSQCQNKTFSPNGLCCRDCVNRRISTDPEIKKRKMDTCEQNFGVLYPMQSEVVMNKSLETFQRNWGSSNYMKTVEGLNHHRKAVFEKTGFHNPMHNPDSFHKQRVSAFKCEILHYRGHKLLHQGSYERRVFQDLIDRGCSLKNLSGESRVTYTGSDSIERVYTPDVEGTTKSGTQFVLEVKSAFTLKVNLEVNLAKFRSANKQFRKQAKVFVLCLMTQSGIKMYTKFPTKRKVLGLLKADHRLHLQNKAG